MLSICIELGVEILSRTVGASQRPQIYLLGFWAKKHNVTAVRHTPVEVESDEANSRLTRRRIAKQIAASWISNQTMQLIALNHVPSTKKDHKLPLLCICEHETITRVRAC